MTQWQPPRHSMSMYASKDDMLASVMKENEELHAKLAEEAARTAEQKLRADQISKQHDMQCAMHKEAVERAMRAEAELEAVGAGGVQALRKQAAAPQAVQPAIMPKGESAAAQLRAMATNYPAGHSWDKLDARACIRGALEIEALRALLAAAPAHPAEAVHAAVPEHETCETCQGNGEIVTDWERYKHPHVGDKGDEAVSDCQECQGTGEVTPAHPAEGAPAQAAVPVVRGEVLVTVSGFTGSGKSAIAGEIEIMCRALGLQVEWPDGVTEKNMTHADWTTALELYNPRVRIIERNVPRNTASGADQ